jgi:hypothetical protein
VESTPIAHIQFNPPHLICFFLIYQKGNQCYQ